MNVTVSSIVKCGFNCMGWGSVEEQRNGGVADAGTMLCCIFALSAFEHLKVPINTSILSDIYIVICTCTILSLSLSPCFCLTLYV